jgi:5'-AMP-activated protein kinase catalytic alpha subunit
VVHRDIKLDNILLDQSGRIKICDFGVSKQVSSEKERMFDQCGTPAYIAPEIIGGKGYKGFKADMWSAGVCLYVMLIGTVPFRANTLEQLQELAKKGKFDTQNEMLSSEALDLLHQLINVDYRKRLSAKETLNHPWFHSTEMINIERTDLADIIFTEKEK